MTTKGLIKVILLSVAIICFAISFVVSKMVEKKQKSGVKAVQLKAMMRVRWGFLIVMLVCVFVCIIL